MGVVVIVVLGAISNSTFLPNCPTSHYTWAATLIATAHTQISFTWTLEY